ncbi:MULTISPECIES: hypothetical protein [Pseudomonas]|jgi:hypothetical protein|uniref:hypothetical protein n=1 Tax=Pseudomonas TaxID=286 RepID=UPI0018E8C19C|nr:MULTISPECIES: hypothetical protein [Pseudomonas]MBJ2213980.1 hypothetical protein [Pseudomonas carnis]MBP5947867.1 hypothetical protein [Pseudomonas sp. P9(2020)]
MVTLKLSPVIGIVAAAFCIGLISGCAFTATPEQLELVTGHKEVIRVPVYIVPNCDLPEGACQWIVPSVGETGTPSPEPVYRPVQRYVM